MSATTTIEWATKSWNPVRGCSRVSPGCDQCYAMKFARRFSGAGKPYDGLTTIRKGNVDWSGVARFIPSELNAPLRWRRAERVFVNSMSDLFHHSLSFDQIDAIFGVMWSCLYIGRRDAVVPGHEFLILTKRAERMVEYFSTDRREQWAYQAVHRGGGEDPDPLWDQTRFHEGPHPRIWLGVSVENQETADERIPLLLKCPAAVRWISAEPLLGALDLRPYLGNCACMVEVLEGAGMHGSQCPATRARLDWVVFGSESGPGARAMDLSWGASIVDQCAEAGVPCFTKQIANNNDKKGGKPEFWPARDGGWPREYPEAAP